VGNESKTETKGQLMKRKQMATSMGLALVTVLVAGIEVQAETPAGFVPIKAVRASSERAEHPAINVADGNHTGDSRWISHGGGGPKWIELELPQKEKLVGLHVFTGFRGRDTITDFVVQFKRGDEWVNIPSTETSGNTAAFLVLHFDDSIDVETDTLRLWITQTPNNVARISGFIVWSNAIERAPDAPPEIVPVSIAPERTVIPSTVRTERTGSSHVLWDDHPASGWDNGYPVGSGRLGAIALGSYPQERILINEETIWYRNSSPDRVTPENSFEHLEEVRRLEAAGKFGEAGGYFQEHLCGRHSADAYQFFGWIRIDYDAAPIVSTYRELDLETGIALHIYTLPDGTEIQQKVFASAPDDVVAVQITANRDIKFSVSIDGSTAANGELVLEGQARGTDATKFMGRLGVRTDSAVTATNSTLQVSPTRQASLYLAIATDYNYENAQQKRTDDWQSDALEQMTAIAGKSCDAIRQDAVADHAQYFSRLSASFGTTDASIRELTTRARLNRIRGSNHGGAWHSDPELIETYLQYSRYLLIASSRPGNLPANLQGVWNSHPRPPWNSDFHLNINLQMNYWHAETANLPEMHTAAFRLVELSQPTGRVMAQRLGMDGWCMPHATDAWMHARLGRATHYGASFLCGQWLVQHIYEHYRFSRDPKVLQRYWDSLTASTRFSASWLIPGPNEGELMARPAASPENVFRYIDEAGESRSGTISAGNTYDQYLIMQSLREYLEAAEVLGKMDDPFVQQVARMLPKVYRPRIGEDGRLMEWRLPFSEQAPGHRHMSHVIGFYPGNQINIDDDPAMRDAVRKTIDTRLRHGGAGPGWSRAWIIGLFARLSDAEEAYRHLIHILRRSTRDNLWNTHPPNHQFQIDGNFGAGAAIIEMLLHSHNDEIKLLPALPANHWPDGHIKGVRARGDYTLEIVWKEGKLEHATITAGANAADGPVRVVYGGNTTEVNMKRGQTVTVRAHSFQKPEEE
jgi:alpha-L-fucosidase 2